MYKNVRQKNYSIDVIELPHLKDDPFNPFDFAPKRFYVVEDVNRASEGFSKLGIHLYRLKLKQIYDTQEYKDMFDQKASEGSIQSRDLMSNLQ